VNLLLSSWDSPVLADSKELIFKAPYALYILAKTAQQGKDELMKKAAEHVTAAEYWRLARDPFFNNIKATVEACSQTATWKELANNNEHVKSEDQLSKKLISYIEENNSNDARKLINEADVRRLPYSRGQMGGFIDRVRVLYGCVNEQQHGQLFWTPVHFLIVSAKIEETDKIHAIKSLVTNSGFHMK